MKDKELIELSYDTYYTVLEIINIITDGNYISVTEFSDVLNIIFNTDKIKPHYINKYLQRKKIVNKNSPDKKSKLKYCLIDNNFNYSQKVYFNDLEFYIWDANFLFRLFHIDLSHEIELESVKLFCKTIYYYSHTNYEIKEIYSNLLKLQIILKTECNLL